MALSPLELTQALIRFKTINPPGDEGPCVEYLSGILEDAGFRTELVPFGEGRSQLIAKIGRSVDERPLCFTGHVDTVPLGAKPWSVDPFAAEVSDGKLFGRGSSDMKSGVAAFVAASVNVADQLADKPGIVLIITAGEETGCAGAFNLAKQQDKLGKAGALVVAEPTGNLPFVGHKGAMWLTAKTEGVTVHGSMPELGVNAIYRAARAISALENFDFNVARHPVMGAPTLNVGTVSGGLNINSVPDSTAIGIDIRTIPKQGHSRIRNELESYLGKDVAFDTLLDVESVWTAPEGPWVGDVFDIIANITGSRPQIATAPYFTDACALTPALGSPPTIILGPGELSQAHQTDEYCFVNRIRDAAEIYTAIIRKWCSR
jgi:succinyl-diaminopimelate desuccinylase